MWPHIIREVLKLKKKPGHDYAAIQADLAVDQYLESHDTKFMPDKEQAVKVKRKQHED